jgi:hypothetical protein
MVAMNETVAQVRFVLDSWIPFAITLVAVVTPVTYAIYWAFNWRYQGVIDKTRTLWDLTKEDLKRSEQATTELAEKLGEAESEIAQLRTELTAAYDKLKQPVPADVDTLIDKAVNSTSDARVQLDKLRRANMAIRENVDQGIITSGGVMLVGGGSVIRIGGEGTDFKIAYPTMSSDPFAECQQQLLRADHPECETHRGGLHQGRCEKTIYRETKGLDEEGARRV